jgi:hypothetical protein
MFDKASDMRMMPDFGNARDNEIAFDMAASYITNGDAEWGRHILVGLRDFIQNTKETKSLHWILPEVVEVLEYLDYGVGIRALNKEAVSIIPIWTDILDPS